MSAGHPSRASSASRVAGAKRCPDPGAKAPSRDGLSQDAFALRQPSRDGSRARIRLSEERFPSRLRSGTSSLRVTAAALASCSPRERFHSRLALKCHAAMARNPHLEDAILEEPTDLARYVVYGDWLLAQGDPHGELVSVQASLASTKDTKRFLELKETEKRLLAAVTAGLVPIGAQQLTLGWRYGFVNKLEVRLDGPGVGGVLRTLLKQPALRFLQGVRCALPDLEQAPVLEALIAALPPLLNRLELVNGTAHNLAAFQTAFPKLEHFVVEGNESAVRDPQVLLGWPELRTLELSGLAATDALCDALRPAPWKKLRRVVLSPAPTREQRPRVEDVSAVLALPELRHIGLSAHIEGAIAVVAKRPNLSALQELELLDFISNERIEPLLARKDAIRSLKLVIHQGELSLGLVKQLRKAVKGLALGNVEVFSEEEAGVHTMDPDEARSFREREERLSSVGDDNRDDWN